MFCTACGTENPPAVTSAPTAARPLPAASTPAPDVDDDDQHHHRARLPGRRQRVLGRGPPGRGRRPDARARRCSWSSAGPNAGSRFLLDQDVTTAGRHPDSDIFLDDVTVSRRHAEFRREGSGYTVHDVGSLNGTYVNRERIDAAPLSGGDEVQIGKFRLVYLTAAVRAGVGALTAVHDGVSGGECARRRGRSARR